MRILPGPKQRKMLKPVLLRRARERRGTEKKRKRKWRLLLHISFRSK